MPANQLDLAGIFGTITQSLEENKGALNQADEYNQDHGSNMVQTFQTITGALQEKKGRSDSAALTYAAKQLSKNANSGSSKLYAEHLAQAASQVKGKSLDAQGAMQLLQTLIGASQSGQPAAAQPPQGGGDMLGSLLGGLLGGGQPTGAQPSQGGGDLLGSLLGGLMGGGQPTGAQSAQGGDLLGSLLSGLAGGGGLQSLAQAFLGSSGMGNASHRTQSTQVVIQAFLQALTSQGGKS